MSQGTRFQNFGPLPAEFLPEQRVGRRNTFFEREPIFEISLWFPENKGGGQNRWAFSIVRSAFEM